MPPWTILVEDSNWNEFIRSGRKGTIRAAERVRDDFLKVNPLDRVAAAGKMKKLKGRDAGKYQYDLPMGYRMWYTVDAATHTIRIEYIGPHAE